jgi:hypothetical protein
MRWFVENYHSKGGYNLGIYNCRTVRGGKTTSMHGEGRACDCGFPIGDSDGDRLLKRLLKVPGRLGIQAIIYERRIYSAKSPAGRPYTGLVPHLDHLHVEFTKEAASTLTYTTVKRVMATTVPVVHLPGSRPLKKGDTGNDVRWIQHHIGLKEDGIYGDKTAAAVKAYKSKMKSKYPKLVIDGNVGWLAWRAMGVKPTYL